MRRSWARIVLINHRPQSFVEKLFCPPDIKWCGPNQGPFGDCQTPLCICVVSVWLFYCSTATRTVNCKYQKYLLYASNKCSQLWRRIAEQEVIRCCIQLKITIHEVPTVTAKRNVKWTIQKNHQHRELWQPHECLFISSELFWGFFCQLKTKYKPEQLVASNGHPLCLYIFCGHVWSSLSLILCPVPLWISYSHLVSFSLIKLFSMCVQTMFGVKWLKSF